jgi:hypothetical protein
MIAGHRILGLSDALLVVLDRRDAESQLYNSLMVATFLVGVCAFVAHSIALAWMDVVTGRNRTVWIVASLLSKSVLLIIYWYIILIII